MFLLSTIPLVKPWKQRARPLDRSSARSAPMQQGEKRSANREEKAKLAAKRNEAFSRRVETCGGTQLEEKKLRLKILAAEIKQGSSRQTKESEGATCV